MALGAYLDAARRGCVGPSRSRAPEGHEGPSSMLLRRTLGRAGAASPRPCGCLAPAPRRPKGALARRRFERGAAAPAAASPTSLAAAGRGSESARPARVPACALLLRDALPCCRPRRAWTRRRPGSRRAARRRPRPMDPARPCAGTGSACSRRVGRSRTAASLRNGPRIDESAPMPHGRRVGGSAHRLVRVLGDACALAGAVAAATVAAASLGSLLRPGGPGSGAGRASSPRAAHSGGGEQHGRRRRGRRLCRPVFLRSDAGAAMWTPAAPRPGCGRGLTARAAHPSPAAPCRLGGPAGGSRFFSQLSRCLLVGRVSPQGSGRGGTGA